MSGELFWQGLSLTILGMGITFAALGLLILAIIVLERLFRTRRLIPDEQSLRETPVVNTLARDTEEEEITAAIAVALAHFRSLDICRSGLGASLESGPGPWWVAGQAQQSTFRSPPPPSAPASSESTPTIQEKSQS